MRFKDLVRDQRAVLSHLQEQEDNSVYTDVECRIYFPKRWEGTPLAQMDDEEIYVLAMFILVVGNKYTWFNGAALMNLKPSSIASVFIDDVECTEFTFLPGDVVIGNLNLAQDNTLPYYIGEIIVNKGNVVPYLTEDDFLQLLITCDYFAGLKLPNYAYVVLYLSHVIRLKRDKSLLARAGKEGEEITFIPFNNVMYATNNTMAKFNGANLDEGIQGALVYPSKEASNIEKMLRV